MSTSQMTYNPSVIHKERRKKEKPPKPYPEFPLYAHTYGRWAKTIGAKTFYFGSWDDPMGALNEYADRRAKGEFEDVPKKSKRPSVKRNTMADLARQYLKHKAIQCKAGEIQDLRLRSLELLCEFLVGQLPRTRTLDQLEPAHFAKIKARWISLGAATIARQIGEVKSMFTFAWESGLMEYPPKFGPGFKPPGRAVLRRERADDPPKFFPAGQIREMLRQATPQMRAMVLLGINGGLGRKDLGSLPTSCTWPTGWIDYPRPKTGIARRIPLWPETVEAIKHRGPTIGLSEKKGRIFVSRYGGFCKLEMLTDRFNALLAKCGIDRAPGLSFYGLRRTFRTIADRSKDLVAIDLIMGHAREDMGGQYTLFVEDERLRAVVDTVRDWLFNE